MLWRDMFHVLAKDEGPFEKVLHLMGRTRTVELQKTVLGHSQKKQNKKHEILNHQSFYI
jgi:hypothetical protein